MTSQSPKNPKITSSGLEPQDRTPGSTEDYSLRAQAKSDVLDSVHQLVADLHEIGLVSTDTLNVFNDACLDPSIENSTTRTTSD
jgi:hypothetical protein